MLINDSTVVLTIIKCQCVFISSRHVVIIKGLDSYSEIRAVIKWTVVIVCVNGLNKNLTISMGFCSVLITIADHCEREYSDWRFQSWPWAMGLCNFVNSNGINISHQICPWLRFNPGMDKYSHTQQSVGWNHLSNQSLQRHRRWSLGC